MLINDKETTFINFAEIKQDVTNIYRVYFCNAKILYVVLEITVFSM